MIIACGGTGVPDDHEDDQTSTKHVPIVHSFTSTCHDSPKNFGGTSLFGTLDQGIYGGVELCIQSDKFLRIGIELSKFYPILPPFGDPTNDFVFVAMPVGGDDVPYQNWCANRIL